MDNKRCEDAWVKTSNSANRANRVEIARAALLATTVFPSIVDAYVGPGAGLSVVGVIVGLLAAVFFAIVGFVWYPVNRFLRARRARKAAALEDQQRTVEKELAHTEGK